MSKKLFDGVCTALVTPFKHNEIDFKSLGHLIESQIRNGVNALLILGTTGEAPTISESEREAIVIFATEIVNKRIPLVVGIGGNNPSTIVRYGLQAKSAGADAVLITQPYYNKSTQAGAVKFFDTIIKQLKMPVIVYNIPGRAGMNLEPQTISEICKSKWVVGVKESSGNICQIAEVVRLCPNVAVYCGDDGISLPCYALECVGVVSVASNIRPHETGEIYRLYKQRKVKQAQKLFYSQLPFYRSLFTEVNPIPIKYYLSQQGVCRNELRLPLTPMTMVK